MFFLDRAVSEDKHNHSNWKDTPGTHALLLDQDQNVGPMFRAVRKLRDEIHQSFVFYKNVTGSEIPNDLVSRLALNLIDNEKNTARTIICAFYGFVMKYRSCVDLIFIRGNKEGNIEPFLSNLFKGGLIYESLLKYFYKTDAKLGDIFKSKEFREDFDLVNKEINTNEFEEISNIISYSKGTSLQISIEVTGRLRNTTGHKLLWEDSFKNIEDFESLYSHILRAIYSLTEKKLTQLETV